MFYITTHSTHFIYGHMVKTIQIAREETRCCHMVYSFWLAARVLLYASSHRQANTCHSLCYTSSGALAGTRNSSMGPPWRTNPMTHRTTELPLPPLTAECNMTDKLVNSLTIADFSTTLAVYCWLVLTAERSM